MIYFYIVVRPGDTFKKLSKEFDISQRKLRKYNDLYKGYVLKPGDIIYLDKKHRRADKEHIVHVVRGGGIYVFHFPKVWYSSEKFI